MFLVQPQDFALIVKRLSEAPAVAVDTETTGLHPYLGDRLFVAVFATAEEEYYFDFREVLPREWIPELQPIFAPAGVLIGHNLKFDLHFLLQEGITLGERQLWCTMALARVEYNDHMKYGLAECGERIGCKKDEAVKAYLDSENLFEWDAIPGKKTRKKRYYFDRVPHDILYPYACRDARVAYELYLHQGREFETLVQSEPDTPAIQAVVLNETRLTGVLLKMEHTGIRVDVGYCREAVDYETVRAEESLREFTRLTGVPFVDSAKGLKILKDFGVLPGRTEKGAESYASDVLLRHAENPVVAQILKHRDAQKRRNTYFQNYIHLVDRHGRIHADFVQGGTATGRFSARDPNLQNLSDEDEAATPYPVRRAFLADENRILASLDYAQQEYRLMLDYAGETSVIQQVLGGLDVHTACANLMGVERGIAKNINFALLYGAGVDKLAAMLGVSRDRAMELRQIYFRALPRVRDFIRRAMTTAERRGYIYNWLGRRCYFSPDRSYVAPNHLIQGGGGDIMKVAMVRIDEFIEKQALKTRILVNVHDELLFSIPHDELWTMPVLGDIMKNAYPHVSLPMDVGYAWSTTNWQDLKDGLPEGVA